MENETTKHRGRRVWGGDTGFKSWVRQSLEFRLCKGYIYNILRTFKSKALSGTSTADSLTDFLSDLDRSLNWFLGKVGDVLGRVGTCPCNTPWLRH